MPQRRLRFNPIPLLLLLILLFLGRAARPVSATVGATMIGAARDGNVGQVKTWLKTHPIGLKDSGGHTAFMWSTISGHVHVMDFLKERGAKLNTRDRVRHTPLILAARDGRLEVVRWLIDAGAKLDMRDNSRMSALTWAAVKGHHEVVKVLTDAGANIEHEDHKDWTPHDWAVHKGHDHIADHLEQQGATSKAHRASRREAAEAERVMQLEARRAAYRGGGDL